MDLLNIASRIRESAENIILIYAFNGTGKTRLSVKYKDITKDKDGGHTGLYYNAFSEDLFVWDNDESHNNLNVRLRVLESSLNAHHSYLLESEIVEDREVFPIDKWLDLYSPKYSYKINRYYSDENKTIIDEEKGIESFSFYLKDDVDQHFPIKLSRGEERTFVWSFYLALFEQLAPDNQYIYIDDPVSSLDDHNVFLSVFSIIRLMQSLFGHELYFSKESNKTKKLIISTHHIGFATIISNWIEKGEFVDKFKKRYKPYILANRKDGLSLESVKSDVLLYHLRLLQKIEDIVKSDGPVEAYHVALLRQLLENIASFLGAGYFSHALKDIGYTEEEASKLALQINSLTHQDIYSPHVEALMSDVETKEFINEIYERIVRKYSFITHSK